MEELAEGFWVSLIMMVLGIAPPADPLAVGPDIAAPWLRNAVLYGENKSLTDGIEMAYQAAGASQNETLTWQFQPFDGIVNWYNNYSEVINLSALPGDTQIEPYWDNWSAVLTGGRWDWRSFFADETEAREMARFNQLVLAAHEYGHALTYRYDPGHVWRENNEVNCRELPADRLAAGLLEDLAATEPDFAHWRLRYGELAGAINAEIDEASRYTLADYESLDADCHIISVAQPTEDTMTPYASAYFARWQVLLATDLPPLSVLYERYLYPALQADLMPAAPLASWVETVEWLEDDLTSPFERDGNTGFRKPAFAPDGQLFVLHSVVSDQNGRVGLYLAYGPADGKRKIVIDTPDIGVDMADPYFFDLAAFLPLGADRFLLASADMWGEAELVALLDFRRSAMGWSHTLVQLPMASPALDTRLRGLHDGTLSLDIYQDGAVGQPSSWTHQRLDPDTLELGESEIWPDTRPVWFSELPDGRSVLIDQERPSILLESDGDWVRIAGNGLAGYKDSLDPLGVEFLRPVTAIGIEGRIRVLDLDPHANKYTIREITLVP